MTRSEPIADYVCPGCRGPLGASPQAWRCDVCAISYPVLHGMADFRVQGDAYLELDAERAKAAQLADAAAHMSFDELLALYYSMTDDVTPQLAQRYRRYMHNGPANAQHLADNVCRDRPATVLDAGCGTGAFAVAASKPGRRLIVVDIALRWLIICRKRLEEAGVSAEFVCADIAAAPFKPGSFDAIGALDLLEHTDDPAATIKHTAALLAPGGRVCFTGANRYVLGPHPSGRIWFAGYLPASLRAWISNTLRGYDSLRNTRLLSPLAIAAQLRGAGLTEVTLRPRQLGRGVEYGSSVRARWATRLYRWLSTNAVLRPLIIRIGPAFEVAAVKAPTTRRQQETK